MKKKSTAKKVLLTILGVLLALVIVLVGTVYAVWHDEITTLLSFQQVTQRDESHKDGSVYVLNVSGGYHFDEFLAQGGASNDTELISFITNSITKGIIPMSIKTSEIACSAFTADTADGDRVFGRNYDFHETNTVIVYTNPGNGRHASYSTLDLQFLGLDSTKDVTTFGQKILTLAAPFAPLDGVNDAGVACGIFMSYQGGEKVAATNQQTDKPDLTSTTMLRMILDYADSVEEAVELVEKYDLHDSAKTSFHYMIADSTGKSAILEWVSDSSDDDADGANRHLNVIWNDADPLSGATDWQMITNFIITPDYYTADANKPGLDRYELLRDRLAELNGVVADEEAAMGLLDAVSHRDWGNPGDSNSLTIHSAVYNLTDKTVLWVGNEHYGEESYTFRFSLNK